MAHTIWTFQEELSRRLLGWSQANLLAGAVMGRIGDDFWQGVGAQAAGWGAVNAAIALIGRRSARKRQADLPDPNDTAIAAAEGRKLRRILLVNAGLDVLYIAGGLSLAATKGKDDDGWRGHGYGIAGQGVWLLFFDLLMAKRVRNVKD